MKWMCFTFTVQIMRRIPILMLYFWDHYSRLLESITRKTRKIHPALWISGIISCMLGYLDEITGEYATPEGYLVDEQDAEEFDKKFS